MGRFHRRILVGCIALAAFALAGWACGLKKDGGQDMAGPSGTSLSVELNAVPDTVNADGVSTSVVRVVLRDQLGRPFSGRSVLFEHDGDGRLLPQGGSTYVGPVQSGIVMSTASDGTASVVYVAGRQLMDLYVYVRPYGVDSSLDFYRIVQIQQR